MIEKSGNIITSMTKEEMLSIIYNEMAMKYLLTKDLPTFKAGTEAWLSEHGNLITLVDGEILVIYAGSTIAKFPNILTEWFTPVEEKRKVVPDEWDQYFVIPLSMYLL